MTINPQTVIYLCKTPLENDYKNQLTFSSLTAQDNYFNSRVFRSFGTGTNYGYTYVRKESRIDLECKMDDVIGCNYLFYRNVGFSTKTYYCFITKMEYINEDTTRIYIETDVYQTWMFDINIHPCFVEREHVADDTIGKNTVPESVETGEYEIVDLRYNPMYEDSEASPDWLPCFCVTSYPNDITNLQENGRIAGDYGQIGGVFSTLKFFSTSNFGSAQHIIDFYNSGHGVTLDEIKNIFMIPRCCVNVLSSGTSTVNGYPFYPVYNYAESDTKYLQAPLSLAENFHPKNNKLYTYPYSYMYATNNVGEQIEIRYEDLPIMQIGDYTLPTLQYKNQYVPSCGVSAKMIIEKYKSYTQQGTYPTEMYNYGINFAKCPVCAWSGDYYTNWLTQNGVNMNTNVVSGAVSGAVIGGMTGGGIGAVIGAGVSLVNTIGNIIGETHKAETMPDYARGNVNTGDYTFCFARNIISIYQMSVRPEYARIIDEYFSMFGYKINRVKTLQFNSRPNWNYIKTVGCNIDGDIPQEDLGTLRKMFDTGVTMWHNPSTMYDYSQNNNV